jgi:hypothetical protein
MLKKRLLVEVGGCSLARSSWSEQPTTELLKDGAELAPPNQNPNTKNRIKRRSK